MPTLCNVTGSLYTLAGVLLPNQALSITKVDVQGQDGSTVIPLNYEVTSDGSGDVDFDIFPGNYLAYIALDRRVETFTLAVPETTTANLHDIIDQAAVPITPSDVILSQTAASEAQASAVAAALYDGPAVDEFSELAGLTSAAISTGDYVRVISLNAVYECVASGGDLDYTGSGGLEFDVLTPKARAFGTAADGSTDDSAIFTTIDTAFAGKEVDLEGLSYAVSAVPTGAIYVHGSWEVSGDSYPAPQSRAVISSSSDTGSIGTPYASGVYNYVQVAGRTCEDTLALIASQNCWSEFARGVCLGSIHSRSIGNVSGCIAARQSAADIPQSIIMNSEECLVIGGFGGVCLNSQYSMAHGERPFNLGARLSYASGKYGGNVSAVDCYAGRGGGSKLVVTIASEAVSSIAVEIAGAKYEVGDDITIYDRSGPGTGATAEVASINGTGGITGVTVTNGGSDYSTRVDAVVDNGTGDYAGCVYSSQSEAWGETSGCFATYQMINKGIRSASVAAQSGSTDGNGAAQISASGTDVDGDLAFAFSANICEAVGAGAIVSGRRARNETPRSFAFGDASSGAASTANRKFHVFSNGDVQAAGSITGSVGFADYAEYFKNATGEEIPTGSLVALEGDCVRTARASDDICGAVSATAVIAANDSPFAWGGRYMRGEFGEPLYENILDPDWSALIPDPDWPMEVPNPLHPQYDLAKLKDAEGNDVLVRLVSTEPTIENPEPAPLVKNPTPQPTVLVLKENPEYVSDRKNIPRSARPDEWTCVGLVGQIHVRCDAGLMSGNYVKSDDFGRATKSPKKTNIRCMKITQEYDNVKGYGVALCFIGS